MLGLLVWLAMVATEPEPSGGCSVSVVGMPVPAMPHHQLIVGQQDEVELSPTVRLPPLTEAVRLRVLGPRYRGDRTITPEQCRPDAELSFQVMPKPASLSFPCAPEGLTVTCRGCPGLDADQPYLGSAFPSVPMSASHLDVELLLRAPNRRRRTTTARLYPGPNTIQVELEQLSR